MVLKKPISEHTYHLQTSKPFVERLAFFVFHSLHLQTHEIIKNKRKIVNDFCKLTAMPLQTGPRTFFST